MDSVQANMNKMASPVQKTAMEKFITTHERLGKLALDLQLLTDKGVDMELSIMSVNSERRLELSSSTPSWFDGVLPAARKQLINEFRDQITKEIATLAGIIQDDLMADRERDLAGPAMDFKSAPFGLRDGIKAEY